MSDRMDRISQQMCREIIVILQSDIDDPRIEDVSITKVEVTRDLRNAKIFYVISEEREENAKDDINKGLRSAACFIRGKLAERIVMKFMPKLLFVEDLNEEKKESIDRIFKQIEKEQDR
ncbi:MAG: 30S ribosome-binding factor RbfA [Candidatus Omnitrophota bacterium]